MKTLITESIEDAAEILRNGGTVAFPTETVFGLGASALDKDAVSRVFAAKGRPSDNPLIVHVSTVSDIDPLVTEVPESAKPLIEQFFPGALTIIFRKSDGIPANVSAGLDSVAIRMPSNDTARRFIEACGVPVVAPSANLSGRPSPTTWEAVAEDLEGRIDCVLKGEPTKHGVESTVVDCTGEFPLLLRPGAIGLETLRTVVPELKPASTNRESTIRSPGLRHLHYSPRARVLIGPVGAAPAESAYIGLSVSNKAHPKSEIHPSPEQYAARIYEFFRECDRDNITLIFCETVENKGIGLAINDRINRASERK